MSGVLKSNAPATTRQHDNHTKHMRRGCQDKGVGHGLGPRQHQEGIPRNNVSDVTRDHANHTNHRRRVGNNVPNDIHIYAQTRLSNHFFSTSTPQPTAKSAPSAPVLVALSEQRQTPTRLCLGTAQTPKSNGMAYAPHASLQLTWHLRNGALTNRLALPVRTLVSLADRWHPSFLGEEGRCDDLRSGLPLARSRRLRRTDR